MLNLTTVLVLTKRTQYTKLKLQNKVALPKLNAMFKLPSTTPVDISISKAVDTSAF